MERISITVKIAALGQNRDFIVPNNMLIGDVITLVAKVVTTEYGIGNYGSNLMFFDAEDGQALCIDRSSEQQGIYNGSKLLLI